MTTVNVASHTSIDLNNIFSDQLRDAQQIKADAGGKLYSDSLKPSGGIFGGIRAYSVRSREDQALFRQSNETLVGAIRTTFGDDVGERLQESFARRLKSGTLMTVGSVRRFLKKNQFEIGALLEHLRKHYHQNLVDFFLKNFSTENTKIGTREKIEDLYWSTRPGPDETVTMISNKVTSVKELGCYIDNDSGNINGLLPMGGMVSVYGKDPREFMQKEIADAVTESIKNRSLDSADPFKTSGPIGKIEWSRFALQIGDQEFRVEEGESNQVIFNNFKGSINYLARAKQSPTDSPYEISDQQAIEMLILISERHRPSGMPSGANWETGIALARTVQSDDKGNLSSKDKIHISLKLAGTFDVNFISADFFVSKITIPCSQDAPIKQVGHNAFLLSKFPDGKEKPLQLQGALRYTYSYTPPGFSSDSLNKRLEISDSRQMFVPIAPISALGTSKTSISEGTSTTESSPRAGSLSSVNSETPL